MRFMRWMTLAVLTVPFVLLLLAGCQTTEYGSGMTKEGKERSGMTMEEPGAVSINTVPLGAEIYIDGEFKGNTPMTIKLDEGKDYKLELKEEEHGYETQTMTINSETGSVNVNMPKKR